MREWRHPCGQRQWLAVADLCATGGAVLRAAAAEHRAEVRVVYSDPPWNPGNEKYWRRHAGAAPPVAYAALLDAWCATATAWPTVEHILCEQSASATHRQLFHDAVARCAAWSLPLREEWVVYYGSPGSRSCVRPNVLLHFGHQALRTDPTGLRGEPMTYRVFEGLALARRAVVADPCLGKGMTSRMAHQFGLNCLGIELNSARLAYAERWLARQGYVA